LSLILGHKVETFSGGGKKLTAHAYDEGEYVGVGFYSTTLKSGTKKYRAVWLRKVKFGIPNESLETKGDSINFQTPQIEGVMGSSNLVLGSQGTWCDFNAIRAICAILAGKTLYLPASINTSTGALQTWYNVTFPSLNGFTT